MSIVFLETTGDRHAQLVSGVTALERKIREHARAGASKILVAGSRVDIARAMPVPVEYVPAGTSPPDGARVDRADVIAGIELSDDAAIRRAERALIRTMNKSFEGPVDALINWRFSMPITRVLARRSFAVTPNQVTILAICIGLVASYFASRGAYAGAAIGGALLQTQSILDSVDGELARLRFQYSKLGQWLDNMSDDIVDNAFIVASGYALGGVWLYLGIAAASGRVLNSVVQYVDVYRRTGTGDVFAFRFFFESDKVTADDVYDPKAISTWLRSFGRRDTYVFLWMIACVAGFPLWVVLHGLVIAAVNDGLLLLHFTVYRHKRPR